MRQLFSRPQALAVTGGFLAILMFTSLPRIPLLTLGGACLGIASMLNRREAQDTEAAEAKADADKKTPSRRKSASRIFSRSIRWKWSSASG